MIAASHKAARAQLFTSCAGPHKGPSRQMPCDVYVTRHMRRRLACFWEVSKQKQMDARLRLCPTPPLGACLILWTRRLVRRVRQAAGMAAGAVAYSVATRASCPLRSVYSRRRGLSEPAAKNNPYAPDVQGGRMWNRTIPRRLVRSGSRRRWGGGTAAEKKPLTGRLAPA